MKSGHTKSRLTVDRRTFCNELLLTSSGMALAPAILRTAAAQSPSRVQDSMVAYPPVKIEGAETLLPGQALYFNYPTRNHPAVLVRSREDEFSAYSRRCSHGGCSVEYDPPHRCFSCPCHHGAYDVRMGHVIYGPPRTPLDQIVLQIRRGGEVWAVGKSFGRNAELVAGGAAK